MLDSYCYIGFSPAYYKVNSGGSNRKSSESARGDDNDNNYGTGCSPKGIIFDLDGVLVDSMPTHFKAWEKAFLRVAGIRVAERDIYSLEGMRGMELIRKIFEQKGFADHSLAQAVSDEKDRIFKTIRSSRPFAGAQDLVRSVCCAKAAVSGSGRGDVLTILGESFGLDSFSAIITADDVRKGKPDPSAFLEAAKRMGVRPSEAVVVENAPLGAQAAKNAGIGCLVVLNNTPLSRSDFDGIVARERILDATGSLKGLLPEEVLSCGRSAEDGGRREKKQQE